VSASRVIRRPPVGVTVDATHIEYEARAKSVAQSSEFCFDLTNYPQIAAGATISSVSVPAVSGITATPAGSAPVADDYEGPVVGKFWLITISGGTSGTDYLVKANFTLSSGAVLPVWLLVQVR